MFINQTNGSFSRIFNQMEQLLQRVGRLEEIYGNSHLRTHEDNAGQSSGGELTRKITPLLYTKKSLNQKQSVFKSRV